MILMCNKNVSASYLKSDLLLVGGGGWVNHGFVLFETWASFVSVTWNRAELLSLLTSTYNYYKAFNVVVLSWRYRAVNAWMAIILNTAIKMYKAVDKVFAPVSHIWRPQKKTTTNLLWMIVAFQSQSQTS
jgi:hypothetical protein